MLFELWKPLLGRYSIWLDSKMRLNSDPMLIIEYFLWRRNAEYAISNHYDRHCVWDEVLQNKRLNKYNHTAIDEQFNFYQSDGLTEFDPSNPNNPLPSCESPLNLCSFWNFCCVWLCIIWFQLLNLSHCRCSWGFLDNQGTYSHVKFIFMPLVQWSWSIYFSWSAKLCLYLFEIQENESWETISSVYVQGELLLKIYYIIILFYFIFGYLLWFQLHVFCHLPLNAYYWRGFFLCSDWTRIYRSCLTAT